MCSLQHQNFAQITQPLKHIHINLKSAIEETGLPETAIDDLFVSMANIKGPIQTQQLHNCKNSTNSQR